MKKYKISTGSVMTTDERNTSTSRCWNCGSHSGRYFDERRKERKKKKEKRREEGIERSLKGTRADRYASGGDAFTEVDLMPNK